jgi:hypothetical protein
MYFHKNQNQLKIIFILTVPLVFFFTSYLNGIYFTGDTLAKYQAFKFFHNYYDYYDKFPLWVDLNFGLRSFFLFNQLDSLGVFFVMLSNLFKINSYSSFLIYISIYYSIFFYGLHLNTANLNHLQFNALILLTLISDVIQYNIWFSAQWFCFLPYIYYFSKKYFENLKIIYLVKIIIIFIITFLNKTDYLIIPIFYIYSLVIIFFFIINLKKNNLKKIHKSFAFKKKYLLLILLLIFIFLLYYYCLIKIYLPMQSVEAPFRDGNYKVNFNTFQNYGSIELKTILNEFFTGTSSNYLALPSFIIIFPLLLIIIKNFQLKKNIYFQMNFLIILILILVSIFKINFIDKIIYSLPFFDFYRHKVNIISITLPFLILLINNVVFEVKYIDKKNFFFIKIISLIYLIFLSTQKNANVELTILQFLFSIFFIYVLFLKKKNIIISVALFLISILFYQHQISLYKHKNVEAFNLNKQIHTEDKINFKKKNNINCLTEEEYKKKYYNIIDFKGASYGYLSLITDDSPCTNFLRFELYNTQKIKITKISDQIPSFDKNFSIKKDLNDNFILTKYTNENSYKGILNIAYDEKWIIKDKNNNYYKVNDFLGFIEINLKNQEQNLELVLQKNYALFYYVISKIILGFIFFFTFFVIFFKKSVLTYKY